MRCMLLKTKKRILIEFMKLESTYLELFCEVNDLIDEEGINTVCIMRLALKYSTLCLNEIS
jgi:hypothetical protein